MPARTKVPEHPPPSCTASTRGNYSGTDLKWRYYSAVVCLYKPLLRSRAAQRDKPSAISALPRDLAHPVAWALLSAGFNPVRFFPCGLQTLRAEFSFATLSLLVPSCDFQICKATPAEFPPQHSGGKSFFFCHILANQSNQCRLCF